MTGEVGSQCNLIVWRDNVEYPITFYRSNITNWANVNFNHIKKRADNKWYTLPGYVWVTSNDDDLRTKWKAGIAHSNSMYKVVSTTREGYWSALPGYRLLSENSLMTVWTPGLRYQDKKIISGQVEGTWQAFPGYVFKNPSVNLDVVPVSSASPTYSSSDLGTAIIELSIAAFLQYFFGANWVSNYLYQESIKDGINYFKQ